MNKRVAALAMLTVISSVSSSWADTAGVTATLINVSGSVSVGGAPYDGGPLKVGDVIRVVGDGEATLAYSDGCGVAVTVKSSVVVQLASPCALAGAGANGIAPVTGVTVTGTGGAVFGVNGTILAVGGAITAAAVVAALALNKPASP